MHSKTQFEPESDSAIGQHLLESNQCARNYFDSQLKILTTACSQFHLSLLEAVYISRKKQICAGKSSLYLLYNCFGKIKACWHWIDCVSAYYLAISLKSISPYCRVHFSLLQNAFLLTAECISPYCIWSLKDPAHHIPNQTEIATTEFCPKSLLRKQNEIDLMESNFQVLTFSSPVENFFALLVLVVSIMVRLL